MGWGEGSGQTVGIERTFLLVSAATRRSEASHTLRPPPRGGSDVGERRVGGTEGWGRGTWAWGPSGLLLPITLVHGDFVGPTRKQTGGLPSFCLASRHD